MVLPSEGQSILVVGGGGFIGRHLCRALNELGVNVISYDRFSPPGNWGVSEWIKADISDHEQFRESLNGVSTVIYLASGSLPATANNDLAAEISSHVAVAIKSAEICCELGVSKFIFASSGGTVYGHDSLEPIGEDSRTKPRNAYGVSKLCIENYLSVLSSLRGLMTVSLRISNPYGPQQSANRSQGFVAALFESLKTENSISIWGDGSVIRDFIYIDDVISAFVKSCFELNESTIVNVGSGVGYSLNQIIQKVSIITGREVLPAYELGRIIDVKSNILSVEKADTLMNWKPAFTIDEGLRKTAEWWELERQDNV